MMQKVMSVLGLMLLLSGCAAEGWYHSWEDERLEQCQYAKSSAERRECELEATKSYQEYKREREQALKSTENKT